GSDARNEANGGHDHSQNQDQTHNSDGLPVLLGIEIVDQQSQGKRNDLWEDVIEQVVQIEDRDHPIGVSLGRGIEDLCGGFDVEVEAGIHECGCETANNDQTEDGDSFHDFVKLTGCHELLHAFQTGFVTSSEDLPAEEISAQGVNQHVEHWSNPGGIR